MTQKKTISPPASETVDESDVEAKFKNIGKPTNFSEYAAQRGKKGSLFGSIHDAFFHYFMRQVWFAIQFFTVFTGKWAEVLDFKRLKIVASDFYDDALRKNVADLVYEVPYKESKRPPIKITVIVEHKAQDDVKSREQTLLNIMRYIVADTELRVKAKYESKSRSTRAAKTPQAIALVVYTGEDPNYDFLSWQETFALPDALSHLAIPYKIPCINLTRLYMNGSLDKIEGFPFVRTVCSIMACAGLKILRNITGTMFSALKDLRSRDFKFVDAINVCFEYAAKACFNVGQEFTDKDRSKALNSLDNKYYKENVMTIFERERYEAKREGKLEELHKWLSRRYPDHSTNLDVQLDKLEDINQVERIFEMAIDSSPLEDIVKYVDKFIDFKPMKKRGKRAVAV